MTEYEQVTSPNFPVELFLDEYDEEFNRVSLPFSYFGHNEDLGSYEKKKFLVWLFNDMVHFMLNCYDEWKNSHVQNDDINDFSDNENIHHYEFNYNLKDRITFYFENVHETHKFNGVDEDTMDELQYTYRQFVYNSMNQYSDDHKGINQLLKMLFDNYKHKLEMLGFRHFKQSVSCSMSGSNVEIINFCLTISRDYYPFGDKELMQNYAETEGAFECTYYNEFKAWYDNVVKITNNFDHDTIDAYLNSRLCDDLEDVKQVFKVPYHGNEMLVRHMVELFNLNQLPIMTFKMKTPNKMVVERTHFLKGPNYHIHNYDNWLDDWCIMSINECNVA
jgi:hypothetical protein